MFKTHLFAVLIISTLLFTEGAQAQINTNRGLAVVSHTPGYFGKKTVVGYDLSLASSSVAIISGFSENKPNPNLGLIHNFHLERAVAKRTSFGLRFSYLSATEVDMNNTRFNASPTDDLTLQHPNFQDVIDSENTTSFNQAQYNCNLENTTFNGYGLSGFVRWYYKTTYAPQGWFIDLSFNVWEHQVSGVGVDFTHTVSVNNQPREDRTVELGEYAFKRRGFDISPGIGYTKGITKRLLFSIQTQLNLVNIFASTRPGQKQLYPFDSLGNFDYQLARAINRQTFTHNRIQFNFGLRYAL